MVKVEKILKKQNFKRDRKIGYRFADYFSRTWEHIIFKRQQEVAGFCEWICHRLTDWWYQAGLSSAVTTAAVVPAIRCKPCHGMGFPLLSGSRLNPYLLSPVKCIQPFSICRCASLTGVTINCSYGHTNTNAATGKPGATAGNI